MPEKKKQHYVPRFYMKRFADTNGKFYLFNLKTEKNVGLVPFKNQCYVDYFYGKDKTLEEKLSLLEANWDVTFQSLLESNYTDSNIAIVKDFSIFQLGRTKETIENETSLMSKMIEHRLTCILEGNNILNDKTLIRAQKLAYEKAENLSSVNKVLCTYEKLRNSIDDLEFLHIRFNTTKKLISSDCPVILLNQYTPLNVGFGMIGLAILIPITPNDVFVLYDKKIYPRYSKTKFIEIKSDYFVKKINALSYANANKIIYSFDPIDKYIFSIDNDLLRANNKEKNNISSLGPNNNKIIMVHRHGIINDFNFPFLEINKEFAQIPLNYREFAPRKHDDKWEEKFEWLANGVPKMLSQMNADGIDENYIIDYEKYHKLYFNLMKKYWEIDIF